MSFVINFIILLFYLLSTNGMTNVPNVVETKQIQEETKMEVEQVTSNNEDRKISIDHDISHVEMLIESYPGKDDPFHQSLQIILQELLDERESLGIEWEIKKYNLREIKSTDSLIIRIRQAKDEIMNNQ